MCRYVCACMYGIYLCDSQDATKGLSRLQIGIWYQSWVPRVMVSFLFTPLGLRVSGADVYVCSGMDVLGSYHGQGSPVPSSR